MKSVLQVLSLLALVIVANRAGAESTHRLYDGLTAFVVNPDGKDFTVTLDVRDLNFYETGPREILVKIYDPDGYTLVRKVIPDDGVTTGAYQHPSGAFDHEAWYYIYCRQHGAEPMVRWSTFSESKRLKALAQRTFQYKVPGGKRGVYRVLLAGSTDHYVTLKLNRTLAVGVSGHPTFLHGHGEMFSRRFLYVPKGATGLHLVAGEWDKPRSRSFKITAANGSVVFRGDTSKGFLQSQVRFDKPGMYDDQILMLEVSDGPGDYLLEIRLIFPNDPEVRQRGARTIAAVLAPDRAAAKAIRNGAFYHRGRVFWHGLQVRLQDWLENLNESDFVIKDHGGKEISLKELPSRDGFISLNGPYFSPPLSDRIMHSWPAHRNRAALNIAIRDVIAGLRSLGPNDHVAVGSPFANMGYEFSNYAWQYWRPAWRIIQQSDAPEDIKGLLREGFLVAGDRLAFCRGWARVNGNSFALIPTALRYCSEATGDPLQKEFLATYFDRFAHGGWGERTGIGPSGPVQEGFAYAYHYASYPLTTWQSVLADFPQDQRFRTAYDRLRTWFSYTLSDERIVAGPWSSRTHYYPHWKIETEGPFAWKGLPGADLTVSVNGGNEWFAARRKAYYVLTYHGRLSPSWNGNAGGGLSGYGGGMICQLHIPGRGLVIASTLNDQYGKNMHPSLWRGFHLHGIVGTCADGRPLVTADSEHFNAKLDGQTVSSSGDLRSASIKVSRKYTFEQQAIHCTVQLHESDDIDLLDLFLKSELQGKVTSAYEMIPFVPHQKRSSNKPAQPTSVTLLDSSGNSLGAIGTSAKDAKTIIIDRGGFGVRMELDSVRPVSRGKNNTVLIELVNKLTSASNVQLEYRLIPFGT